MHWPLDVERAFAGYITLTPRCTDEEGRLIRVLGALIILKMRGCRSSTDWRYRSKLEKLLLPC